MGNVRREFRPKYSLIVALRNFDQHNGSMAEVTTTNVVLPTDLVQVLTDQAKRSGLPLPAYLAFLSSVATRQHDAEFVGAFRFAFSKYPNALRRLAQ
jgi:hypothetical protein